MKLGVVLGIVPFLSAAISMAANVKGGHCEASVDGIKIRNVYIVGDQYDGVVWAYKHLAEETCLTPTTDPDKADAILQVYRFWTPGSSSPGPVSISCSATRNSRRCTDSIGNELRVDCQGGVCNSYYGPSLYGAISQAFSEWLSKKWYESDVALYTKSGRLLWSSVEQKGSWVDLWPDKLRDGTNSPVCKKSMPGSWSRHKYRTYRQRASHKCQVEFDPLVSIDLELGVPRESTSVSVGAEAK
jgi:hypothetical protein